jgi:hypothetical protein
MLLDMTEKANLDLVADNQSFVLDGTTQPFRLLRQEHRGNARVLTADDVLRGDRIGRTGNFGLLKPIVRKKIVDEHNIWYDESNGLGEDFFWLLHCIRHSGKMLFVSDPLYNYRIHQTSWSNTLTKKNYVEMRKLLDRNKDLQVFSLSGSRRASQAPRSGRLGSPRGGRSRGAALPHSGHSNCLLASLHMVSGTRKAQKGLIEPEDSHTFSRRTGYFGEPAGSLLEHHARRSRI